MLSSRRILATLLLVLALLCAAWLWRIRQQETVFPEPATATSPAVRELGPSKAPPAAPDAMAPLPPAGAPISDVADTLQSRADAGDGHAACRLGIELLRCRHAGPYFDYAMQEVEKRVQELRAKGDRAGAEALSARKLRTIEIHQACRGLDPALVARAHHYIRQAALAGEPEAMLRYASGESLGLLGNFSRLRSPEFEHWRREAPAMLSQALAAGRPEAVPLLSEAYRPPDEATTGIIGWLVPNDPVQAHAYALLQQRLSGGITLPGLHLPDLDAAGSTQASALAAEWQQRYFNGVAVDPEDVLYGLPALLDPMGYSKHQRMPERFCEPGGKRGLQ